MLGLGITAVMIAVQFLETGLNTIVKAANTNGMSNFVYIVYSNALAFCVLLPSTYIYHRKKPTPPITTSIILRILLLTVLSCSVQILMYSGIGYSSPTLSSAMMDLLPAFTFILAIISRMENLNPKLQSCQAKVLGTVISIVGALTITLYKGMPIISGRLPKNTLGGLFLSEKSNWLLGGFLCAAGTFSLSLLLIVQAWILKDYPAELMLTTICCGFVVILSTIIALIAEHNPTAWVLRPNMELVAIFYSAIFVVTVRSVATAWACRKKGPLYVSMFNPLGMVIAIGMGFIFLGDALYLGSMIGAAIVAFGFYAVLWGQTQEEEIVDEKNRTYASVSSSSSTPLLQDKSTPV
ncbi:hypothetical protein L6164_020895 [Bauhinia variegata]|uniref:Uncharacterized protein n=1 Tax=Bauhinia variegata TaxID=167791 RepID=A0ACB9MWZ7_BAUVA|nr:hypothetical protein L6164_020895 [Bauhinia variegata]